MRAFCSKNERRGKRTPRSQRNGGFGLALRSFPRRPLYACSPPFKDIPSPERIGVGSLIWVAADWPDSTRAR